MKRHGAEAPIHAAMHADAMLGKCDLEGRAVCLSILSAVKELPDVEPDDWAAVH